MKIVINNFQIQKVLNKTDNEIEPEELQGFPYWNIYCAIDALLYHHVKRYDTDKNKHYDYYPYRKRFKEIYLDSFFVIDLDKDMCSLKSIKSNQ